MQHNCKVSNTSMATITLNGFVLLNGKLINMKKLYLEEPKSKCMPIFGPMNYSQGKS